MYSGSSTGASLIYPEVRVSYVSQDEGSLGDQQWFSSAGHVQGVGSGRDKLLVISTDLFTPIYDLILF
ncbi:hypothetical protein MTR67_007023 [Solanum verrucosum]|uniref:Uncharacterized protein n=1 Tax=Solanum verrucosum TaxID=315347 RepID=A0AAF0PZE9_SOLVR|nr:hypothetical protein MTR67_007023 [Solanum verrucosum]